MIESDSLTGKIRKGRLVGQIRGGGSCLRVGELSKILRKRNRKEGRGNKDFKKGGQTGSKGGCPINGGLKPPYELWYIYIYIYIIYIYIYLIFGMWSYFCKGNVLIANRFIFL